MKLLWLHGLESGPFGSKYRALVDAGYEVLAPDMSGKTLAERVDIATECLHAHGPMSIVGSSYGGLTAVLAAQRYGKRLPALVLCAPGLKRAEVPNRPISELGVNAERVVLIHGRRDEVIPFEVSEEYAHLHGAVLIEVNDGHRLGESLDVILTVVRGAVQ